MNYSSKRTIASIAAGAALAAAYCAYALGGRSPAPEDLKAWAVAMLVFIGIGVAAVIVIQVLFYIAFSVGVAAKERDQDDKTVERIIASTVAEDERDKRIGLKSARVGYVVAGAGFIAGLAALALGASAVAALHILFGTLAAGSIAEGIVSVYYYERGVRNG